MEQDILRSSDVVKIFLIYRDGKGHRKKELVKVRYTENKHVYFVGDSIMNFNKPKWRTKTDIIVYTPNGVYSANVIIRDAIFSLRELLYKVDIPKTWKYSQHRAGSRKEVRLPVTVRFTDNTEIQTETFDLSIGGFSMLDTTVLTSIQTRFPCACSIQFPNNTIISFPDGKLQANAKYIRQKDITDDYELREHKLYCFKFLDLKPDETLIIKNFLLGLK